MASSLATTDPEIRIRKPPGWRQLPEWLRARLRLGVHRAGHLRLDIAAQAGLPTLPPVEICPEVWRVDGDLVLGHTGAVERDGELHLGALLPGPSAVQSDDDLLRAVLVRQFCDCISRLALAATKNTAVSTATPFFDPTFWFGPDDAARLRSWKDPKSLGMEIISGLVAKSVRTVSPPPDEERGAFHVPDWVLSRVESLVERPPTAVGGRS